MRNFFLSTFTALKNCPRNIISGIRYIRNLLYPVCVKSGMVNVVISGIRYIRNSLYSICVKSGMGCVVISGVSYIRFALIPDWVHSGLRQKNPKGDTFVTMKNSPKNVIPGIRYIRNSFYSVRAKSGTGWVIVERDSLALITALKKILQERYIVSLCWF